MFLAQIDGVKSLKALPGADKACLKDIKAESGESFIPVSIDDAVRYWRAMDRKGNELAGAIIEACLAEALERRADAAFGKLRTEDERQRRAALRIKRVDARLGWTDIIKDYQIAGGYYNTPRGRDEFRELTVIVNEALFGQPHFKCDRDTMTVQQQIHIEFFEHALKMQAVTNPTKDPYKLIDDTLKTWAFV